MSWTKVDCKNPRCTASFKVDGDLEKRDCWKCGTTHQSPWNEQPPVAAADGGVPAPADQGGASPSRSRDGPSHASCARCGNQFPTDGEGLWGHERGDRCPQCGNERVTETVPATVDEPNEQQPEMQAGDLSSLVEVLAESDGEFHLHLHQG